MKWLNNQLKTWMFLLFIYPLSVFAKKNKVISEKIVPCDESRPQVVHIPIGRVSVLNFPTNPKEAIPGEAGFDLKTMHQDLVIKALRPGASTNLFVYLEGRRCFFHLISSKNGDEILFVRDPQEKTIEVKFVDK